MLFGRIRMASGSQRSMTCGATHTRHEDTGDAGVVYVALAWDEVSARQNVWRKSQWLQCGA